MKLNRRNALIGLGTIVAGGGAALGTGAFSSVEADRDVSVTTAGDGSAYVQFTNPDGTYADTSDGDGQLQLTFDSVNEDAVSEFDGLFSITIGPDPSGEDAISNEYYVYVREEDNVGEDSPLNIEDGSDNSLVGGTNRQSITYDSDSWGSIDDIGVTIDNTDSSPPESITFVVQNTDPDSS